MNTYPQFKHSGVDWLGEIPTHWTASSLKRIATILASTSATKVGAFPVPLPPLPEQKRIAAYLDASCAAIDAAVEAKRTQIETLDAMILSTIQHAVTWGLNARAKLRNRQYHREPLSKALGKGLFELRHVGKLNTRVRNRGCRWPKSSHCIALRANRPSGHELWWRNLMHRQKGASGAPRQIP